MPTAPLLLTALVAFDPEFWYACNSKILPSDTLIILAKLKAGCVVLDDTGPPLGWFPDACYPVTEIGLEPGDFLLLLTDGIEEAFDPSGEPFGRQRVIDVLRRTHDQPVARIVEAIHRAVRDFHGAASPHDDATVFVARID